MQLDTRLPLLAAQQPALQFQPETRLESLGKIAPAINAMRQLQAQQIDMETELRKRQAFDQFRAAAQQAGLSGDLGQLAQVLFTHGQSAEQFKLGAELMKASQEEARNRRMFGYPSEQAAAMAAPTSAPSMGRKFEQAPVAEAAPEMAMGAAGGAQPVNAMMAMETPAPAPAAQMTAARPAGVYRYGNRTFTQAQLDEMLGHKDTRSIAEAIIKANEPTALERELQVFGQPTTLAGLSALEAAKRAPVQETTAYREYQKAKDEGFKGTFLDYQERLRKAGASNVGVNVSTEKKYGEAFGGKMAEVDINKFTAAEKAPQMAENANRIIELARNPNIFVGPIADIKLKIARALNVAGANTEEIISNTERLIAATSQSTLDAIKGAGLGAGQGFTDKDLQFLQGVAGGTVTLTAQTLTELAQIQHRAAVRAAEAWNKRSKQMPRDVAAGTGLSLEPIVVPPLATSAASRSSVAPPAGGTFPQPPQVAIDALKRGQGTDAQFDAIFGPGAAARARGR